MTNDAFFATGFESLINDAVRKAYQFLEDVGGLRRREAVAGAGGVHRSGAARRHQVRGGLEFVQHFDVALKSAELGLY